MIRVGIIGCGFMGGTHAACYEALRPQGVEIAAVADVRKEVGEALARRYGAQLYPDGMALIEGAQVDVVDVCLPTHLHVEHAVAAMRRGRDVFVEKPVCICEAEMEQILAAQAETGVKVQVGQVIRLWPEYRWLKQACERGEYGRLLCGAFRRLSARPEWASEGWLHKPQLSGGVAVDMHIHDVDFVRYLLGEPDRVQAQAYRDGAGLIQQIFALYGYGKDVGVSIEAGWNYPPTYPFDAGFRVKFERAAVIYSGGEVTVYPDGAEPFHPQIAQEFQGESDAGGNISSLGGYYSELKYFIEGIKGENDLSVATVEEAIRSVRLVKREIELAGGLIAG